MFAAIQWDNPLPWESKNSSSSSMLTKDQLPNNNQSLDQLGPISLRKVAAGRLGNNTNSNFNTSALPSKVYGMNSSLINRALVPSAEQMMSDEMIGSSASRYAAIKEKRAGYFIDTSQDSVGIKDLSTKIEEKSPSNQQYSTPASPDSGSRTITRRNSSTVSNYHYFNLLFILFFFISCLIMNLLNYLLINSLIAWCIINCFVFNCICKIYNVQSSFFCFSF